MTKKTKSVAHLSKKSKSVANLAEGQPRPERCNVIMVDCVDPDNIAAIVLFCLQSQKQGKVCHVVLVARPCDLQRARFSPTKSEFKKPVWGSETDEQTCKMEFTPNIIIEQGYEKSYHNPDHSKALLYATAAHYARILKKCGVQGVGERVKFYDGGIAARAGLSHAIHDYEDLFFDDNGEVVSQAKYLELVEQVYNMTPKERVQFRMRRLIAVPDIPFMRSMYELADAVVAAKNISIYVGGPFTPLARLAEIAGHKLRQKKGEIRAMCCSWTGEKNLLGDNFNNQCDWRAFQSTMVFDAFPSFRKVIITTETCKQTEWITLKADDFKLANLAPVGELVDLWTKLKRNVTQPTFDVAVLFDDKLIPFQLLPVKLSVKESLKSPAGCSCELTVTPPGTSFRFYAFSPDLDPSRSEDAKTVALTWMRGVVGL